MSTFLWIVCATLYLTALVVLGMTTLRKGHTWLFVFGIFLPFLWIVGAADRADAAYCGRGVGLTRTFGPEAGRGHRAVLASVPGSASRAASNVPPVADLVRTTLLANLLQVAGDRTQACCSWAPTQA